MSQPNLAYIPYEDFVADVKAIGAAVRAGDWTPDFVVGIGRGGLVPGAYLSHSTGISMLSVDHSSKVYGFADELLVKLAHQTAEGERILFVDDINDSGSTIAYLLDAIRAHGGDMANARVAVLINNVRSKATVDYWSREIDRSVTKDWFVFPWEAMQERESLIDEAEEVPERLA
ncbi:phosphoribosyltransferase family protein [Sphingomonas naphthae]|uniref:Phosphoribosyltransferase family protein n=1 Tax=Sphingomonas naphthae TaxID=1813468 RepID=A0ABY7TKG4_9SPHN|nr:phosphoribosyltransferase family protein [Sphingomonas naphthae]WCT73717.1 phosphoribosyltransferase family protein [Sphingomonas naphthae]